jgi:hypothetical protein
MSSNKSRPRARRSNDRVDGAGAGGDGGDLSKGQEIGFGKKMNGSAKKAVSLMMQS